MATMHGGHTAVQVPLVPAFSNGGSAGLPTLAATPVAGAGHGNGCGGRPRELVTGNACVSPAGDVDPTGEGRIHGVAAGAAAEPVWSNAAANAGSVPASDLMIVQMFGTMHRDQMATIREELDQLRELTREFQARQARTGRAIARSSCRCSFRHLQRKRPSGLQPTTMASTPREHLESVKLMEESSPSSSRTVLASIHPARIPTASDGSEVTSRDPGSADSTR